MCGPSSAENTLSGESTALSQQLSGYLTANYGQQQDILNELNNIYSPIAAAGPNQTGFSAGELNALNTGAVDTAAGNYSAAERQVASNLAGSGTNAGPSGVQQQIEASVGSAAAGQASQAENQIQQENYTVGRQNWQQAMAGLSGVANAENPEAFAGLATQANQNAFGEASQIQQQNNQLGQDLFGLAGAALGNLNTPGLAGFSLGKKGG